MKKLIILLGLVLFHNPCTYSQSSTKHLVIVNNESNQQIKELYVGDKVKLKLSDSSIVKGTIISIDTSNITVDLSYIRYDEIMKISTKKGWVKGVGTGLIVGGVVWAAFGSIAGSEVLSDDELSSQFLIPGLLVASAGVVMMLPNYHDMGKFSLIVIDRNGPLSKMGL